MLSNYIVKFLTNWFNRILLINERYRLLLINVNLEFEKLDEFMKKKTPSSRPSILNRDKIEKGKTKVLQSPTKSVSKICLQSSL